MAWTAPRTWVVSEIVTAALMNTHVRDNLAYLKGQAGTVAIEAGATFDAACAISGSGGNLLVISGTTTTTGLAVTMANVASQNAQLSLTNTGQRNALIYMDRAADKLKISQNGTANPAISIDANGFVGINNATVPKGMLHGYDTISGFVKYEFDGVDGTARTVIPDGAGDVLYGVMPIWAVRHSGGTTQGGSYSTGGTGLLTPGNTLDIYSSGGNILQLQVAANGSVTVQRTAGTGTYKVTLLLQWL